MKLDETCEPLFSILVKAINGLKSSWYPHLTDLLEKVCQLVRKFCRKVLEKGVAETDEENHYGGRSEHLVAHR